MRIVRAPRTARFTTLSNDLIEDSRLSFKARGLLAYLLSRPDGWQTDAHRLAARGPDGRAAILSGLKELENASYLKRTRSQDEHGRWTTACEVFDTPTEVRFSDVGSPNSGLPNSGSPNAGRPNSKSKTETKTDTVPPNPPTVVGRDSEHHGQHTRCRACGTAGRPKCNPETPGRLSERCRAADGRNCTADWCACPHHSREATR